LKGKLEGFEQTLLEVIQSAMATDEEKIYLESKDKQNPSSIDKKDLFVAFAGGLPSDHTLEELCKKHVQKSKSFLNTSVENILEKYFQDLSSQTEWFISIFNAIHNGIMIADEKGIVRFINPSYTRLTGVKPCELIGKELSLARPSARLPEVIKSGQPLYGVYRKVGSVEYIASMHPIIVQGKVIGGVTIASDITEIQSLNKKLAQYSSKVNSLINRVKAQNAAKYHFGDLLGKSDKFYKILSMAQKLSTSDISVLIQGESGTGKELFAHAIHNASKRSQESFVVVNCAAIPENLLESELFGYEAGAFTGANKQGKLGLLEIADGGTVFLDEIGDMNITLQAKLLRFLQSMEFQRVGGTEKVTVNVRVVAATNQDLEAMIEKETFREDLFYRLNAAQLKIPPLRERKEDIEVFLIYFLAKQGEKDQRSFTLAEETKRILLDYPWPGNVRELENTVNFLTSVSNKSIITTAYLPEKFFRDRLDLSPSVETNQEKQEIMNALERFGKSVNGKKEVARHLGISLATLYNKLKYYGIK
jgi:PAS domain S-box-containing protein